MAIKVGIDNGHGANTAGKRSPDGSLREWYFNHATAKYLEAELKRCGISTVMLSDTETDTSLASRVKKCKDTGCNLLVSIHANAFKGTEWGTWGGIETYAYKKGATGDNYAKAVQKYLIEASKLRDRGVKYDSLYITRESHCPAILIEAGFMDNKQECELLKKDVYRRQTARAIAKGICEVAGIKYVPETSNGTSSNKKIMYRVVAGSYESRSNAEAQMNKLKGLGVTGVFLEAKEMEDK